MRIGTMSRLSEAPFSSRDRRPQVSHIPLLVPGQFRVLTIPVAEGAVVERYGPCPRPAPRGSALLAVLWLTAALSAIAFTVASTVRSETERSSTEIDAVRTYYLATAAIDRALLYIVDWGPRIKSDGSKYFDTNANRPMPVLRFEFPSGSAETEIIPETAKLNVNTAMPAELSNLMSALGIEQGPAIVAGIVARRSQHSLSLASSFRFSNTSFFEEIEELLLIPGVTSDVFYGSYSPDQEGRLLPHAGLRDCLSVYGSSQGGSVDVNSAEPAVMQAVGNAPALAEAIVALRRNTPINNEQLSTFGGRRLGIVPNAVFTLRATARLRLANGQYSDLRRSVSALVKYPLTPPADPPFHIMRWYDNAFSIQ